MRVVVSPFASRFMTETSPLSGLVMLRPISQLKPMPIATMAIPTAIIPVRVRDWDMARPLDGIAGHLQVLSQTGCVVEAQCLLLLQQFIEIAERGHQVLAKPRNVFGVTLIDGRSQRFKSLERSRMRLRETHNQLVVGADTEVFDDDAHGRNRALEIAADVSERCRVCDSGESTSDVAFTGRKGGRQNPRPE
jgi:hypothetical protein